MTKKHNIDHQKHLEFISEIPQYDQKTEEWYQQRRKHLTSSDAATALGINPYKKPVELLLEKCGAGRSFTGNESTKHGEKYEDIAAEKYEFLMGKKNYNFGMISFGDLDIIRKNKKYKDPKYNFLGGSPDGIAIDNMDMEKLSLVEIKCPMRRKIKHGQIPEYYYPQVQLNMFILDLEISDFIEYVPKELGKPEEINIVRIHRDEEWFDKNFTTLKNFWDEVLLWRKRDIRTHPDYSKYAIEPDNTPIPMVVSGPAFLFIQTDEEKPIASQLVEDCVFFD